MPTTVQFRRGTTAQNDSFTGAAGELSIDTDKNAIRVHDNSTAGGVEIVNVSATQTLTNKTLTSPTINSPTLDMGSSAITNVADPSSAQDAATKAYVDSGLSSLSSTTLTEGNTNVVVADSGTGTVTVTVDGSTHSTFAAAGITLAQGAFVGDVTGNADTATALATARTIAGNSFDGTANITIASTDLSDTADLARLASPALTGTPTAPTAAANTNSTQIATTAYVQTEITDLIGGAPGALDTLNELAAAINDDSSFASTVTTSLGGKVGTTSAQALSTAANAMTVSNATITLARADSTTDVVTVNNVANANACSGNAATATALQTARTIGGVSFDGTASINLPGVNTTGNQNTSGSSASCTGNAATATTLQTARTINGVSFNGSANITVEPYISDDDTGDTNCPVLFTATSTAGYKRIYEDSAFYFNNTANTLVCTNITGTSSAAKYADLAERYTSDSNYEAGTVLIFGGEEEVTESTQRLDKRIAGIVSTDPAYLMNSALENSVAVGLQGRVPCKVVGEIRKGDLMVSSATPGHAEAWRDESNPPAGSVIGKALENKTGAGADVIEVVVGRI